MSAKSLNILNYILLVVTFTQQMATPQLILMAGIDMQLKQQAVIRVFGCC